MANEPRFDAAFPFQDDVLSLPVVDLDSTSDWYTTHFGMTQVERTDQPMARVILGRDDARIGFAVNGRDASQDGAAIRVMKIQEIRGEIEASGVTVANWRVDERDGQRMQVFFVVAPDGLCYYFHEPLTEAGTGS